VDIVDTALSPLGNGTSQPATEPLVASLEGTERDTGLDLNQLIEAADHFQHVADRLEEAGDLHLKARRINMRILLAQVPGGMLSNLLSQLKKQGAEDRFEETLEELPRVREDFGFPPLVTPTSQIVGTQAVLNVLSGERYKMITKESKALVRGEYGRLPKPISDEVKKIIIGDEPTIDYRPADDLKPELDKFREEIKEYIEQEEDVLSYALFPQVAMDFFKYRQAQKYGVDHSAGDVEKKVHPV